MAAFVSRPLVGLARARALLPGLGLCLAVAAAALFLESLELRLFGKAWLESLVLAILAGALVRSLWRPGPGWEGGVTWGARYPLEAGVLLLGVSMDAATLLAAGPAMMAGIAGVVAVAIAFSYGVCRLLGLRARMALLIACGNSICGNSAIAAVAPVINANSDDVAASIAFTAVLGVFVVLGLPALGAALGMGAVGYGALAGLTVYAAPQVLAAAAPFGATAMQMGTLVKLARVLMLGPVCVAMALLAPRLSPDRNHVSSSAMDPVSAADSHDAQFQALGGQPGQASGIKRPRMPFPWFVAGFVLLALARSAGLVPDAVVAPANTAALLLTLVSMAALGLGVDCRVVSRSGWRVIVAAVLSLAGLAMVSLALLWSLGLA